MRDDEPRLVWISHGLPSRTSKRGVCVSHLRYGGRDVPAADQGHGAGEARSDTKRSSVAIRGGRVCDSAGVCVFVCVGRAVCVYYCRTYNKDVPVGGGG